mmetsp:Transcript_65084/g.79645  ORF Transcript_65084/g.79645 Transcript_65084/m.79645 type:complete len:98 (+) Transcript_65084:79-372(+)|eukprot:CAMPEP_0114642024 /NCGR_PEP_ID=MMETSP0191-20121206/2592_1 /TAXON_ID=126664 /ORGANISM="Sorites sp." /LENGTH=97 /DNA_ID=CAMNT_0001854149 /DNA_START=62 /DNA_END=355 /DNA_ORIENTATION=-
MEQGDARRVEESMQRAQRAMEKAMLDLERQEELKFRKVYQILEELSAKQVKLERDVANLLCAGRTAFPTAGYDVVAVPCSVLPEWANAGWKSQSGST